MGCDDIQESSWVSSGVTDVPSVHVLDAEVWVKFNLESGGLNEVVL